VFGPGDHASTYGGNPLACAAGLAVAETFEKENLLANVVARGNQVENIEFLYILYIIYEYMIFLSRNMII
jgi:hypothetical protein